MTTDPVIKDILDHLPTDPRARRIYLAKLAEESAEAAAEMQMAEDEKQKDLESQSLEDLEEQLVNVTKGTPEHRQLIAAHRRAIEKAAELLHPAEDTSALQAELAEVEAKLRTVERYSAEHRQLVKRHGDLINQIALKQAKSKPEIFLY